MATFLKNNAGNTLTPEYERVYEAAANGDFYSLRKSLQSGIPINFINPITTDSPLMAACRKGHSEIVRLCLDFGAKNDPHPDFGQTALHAAVTANQYDCAKILLDIAAASDADYIIANLTDQHSQTPLHAAVLIGSVDLTELLLQHGSKISSVDSYGQTALHICAGSSNEQCLAMLLDHGGDEFIDSVDIYGNTPLHHSAYNGNINCARLLLETAANVAAKNSKNLTAYNLATMQGHHEIGVLLLEYKDAVPAEKSSTYYPPRPHVPSSGGRIAPFSPSEQMYSTPSVSRYEDSEFKTPLQFSKSKAFGSIDSIEVQGLHLPRPHTVSSPSVNPKGNNASRKPSISISSNSSPVDPSIRRSFDNSHQPQILTARSVNDEPAQKSDNGPIDIMDPSYRAVIQLSTPLLSRETSKYR
jgi:ankyrin repeat protein